MTQVLVLVLALLIGDQFADEISQLLYWTQVLMLSRGLSLDDVYRNL